MEVHKHPHHVMHKKKWEEYLLEFLMIFFAIFLGFFAENIREHKVEDSRAKEYAISFLRDLQGDTVSINDQIKTGEIYIAVVDSLLNLYQGGLQGRTAAKFMFYARFLYWTVPLSWNRATFEQIKNSGSLRYFNNYQLLEKLMTYDAQINAIEGEFRNHATRANMLLGSINQVIDPELHYDVSKFQLWGIDKIADKTKQDFFSVKIASIEPKRPAIKEMLNMAVVQQRNLILNRSRLQHAKKLAVELRNELKEEYHLE